MSNHLISEVYKRQVGNMARKAVLVLFADKASDDGTGIWASKQRMAEEIGTTKQTIITTIKSLIEEGLVRECGQRKCPNGFTVEYAINVNALREIPLVASHQSSDLTGKAARPVKQDDLTGKAALPKPSRTPRIKKQTVAHALPANWHPMEFDHSSKCWAIMAEWPPGELETQVEHFIAHHSARGSKFKDWQDAWKTWVLNSRKWKPSHGNANRTGSRQSGDRRSSLARAIDEGLDWLGGSQAGVS